MSTFTAIGNWSGQGVVEGVVTFSPRPAAAGAPVQANITASVVNATVPVIDGSYLVEFSAITLDGELGTIESFVFDSPSGGSVNLNTLVAPAPTVTVGPSTFPGSSQLNVSALGAQLVEAQTPVGARKLTGAAAAKTYFVDDYGADPTAAKPSDTAVAAALAAMGTNPGILEFGPGTYQLSETITLGGHQGVVGHGIEVTTLSFTGTGDCIRLCDPVTVWPPSKAALICGLKIEGLAAGANSSGIHAGDLYNMRIRDVWICDFAAAGCIGLHLENTIQLSERAQVSATIDNCTTAVLFEHSATGDPSFSYSDWDFNIKAFANQNGVVIRNGIMTHSKLSIRGNCFNCGAGAAGFGTHESSLTPSSTNTGVALTVGATSTDTARIQACELFIGLENGGLTASTAPMHTTLVLGTDAFIWASGIINYFSISGFNPWTAGVKNGWFSFAGLMNIDAVFGATASPQTLSYGGALTGGGGYVTNGAVHLESGNAFIIQLTNGNNTLTFEQPSGAAGFAAYELLLIQPASGAPGTLTLPSNAYAVPVPLSLTTSPNEIDVLRIYTFDHNSYYVVQLTT